jgi:hypothetical protein
MVSLEEFEKWLTLGEKRLESFKLRWDYLCYNGKIIVIESCTLTLVGDKAWNELRTATLGEERETHPVGFLDREWLCYSREALFGAYYSLV